MPSRIRRSRRVVLAEREERRRNLRSLRGIPTTGRDDSHPYETTFTNGLYDYSQRVLAHAVRPALQPVRLFS